MNIVRAQHNWHILGRIAKMEEAQETDNNTYLWGKEREWRKGWEGNSLFIVTFSNLNDFA